MLDWKQQYGEALKCVEMVGHELFFVMNEHALPGKYFCRVEELCTALKALQEIVPGTVRAEPLMER